MQAPGKFRTISQHWFQSFISQSMGKFVISSYSNVLDSCSRLWMRSLCGGDGVDLERIGIRAPAHPQASHFRTPKYNVHLLFALPRISEYDESYILKRVRSTSDVVGVSYLTCVNTRNFTPLRCNNRVEVEVASSASTLSGAILQDRPWPPQYVEVYGLAAADTSYVYAKDIASVYAQSNWSSLTIYWIDVDVIPWADQRSERSNTSTFSQCVQYLFPIGKIRDLTFIFQIHDFLVLFSCRCCEAGMGHCCGWHRSWRIYQGYDRTECAIFPFRNLSSLLSVKRSTYANENEIETIRTGDCKEHRINVPDEIHDLSDSYLPYA